MALSQNDLAGAERQIEAYRRAQGATADLAAAIGWEGRAALNAKKLDRPQPRSPSIRPGLERS